MPRYAGHYWRAFIDLDGDRSIGFAQGPIPLGTVVTYARDLLGITDPDTLRLFARMVRAIDREYLRIQAQRSA